MLIFACSAMLLSCTPNKPSDPTPLFTQLDKQTTHITFANQITENDTLNYFTFPYLYLGGGLSVGDINNDGLPDIYLTGNQVPNKLYLNKGNLEFKDISEAAGVAGDERWYSGSTMVDINHDGWLDIYVCVSGKSGPTANQLFINQQDNTFKEEAGFYGIADTSISIQSTFFDYDNDGLLDLFVANYPIVKVSQGNRYYKAKMDQNRIEDSGHLYKNNGDGSFTNVTVEAGVHRFGLTLGIIASDVNQDGYTDLYLSNDFNVPDYLYLNKGDGSFQEISQEATQHTAMFGMGIDAADFNNDGLIDLFQLDMTAEDYKRSKTNMASMSPETFYEAVDLGFNYQYMQNALQLNNGTTSLGYPLFSDISRIAGMATTDWSWGTLFADLDNDGWKDVFVSNGVRRDVNNNDVNLQYESATFFGREEKPDFRLMPSTPIANYAYRNRRDYTFANVTQDWGLDQKGFSNGCVAADLDNDGDLDLVINNMDAPASVYANETSTSGKHFLTVKLNGPEHNLFGLGTKVEVRTGNLEQYQELTLTRGYQSSIEPLLHFGLGAEGQVDQVKIFWPDGKQQILTDVATNQLIQVNYQAAGVAQASQRINHQMFTDISQQSGIQFTHHEDLYDDFNFEPLLPHTYSQLGPALSVGDVNGDGLDDCFMGNALGSPASMYVQKADGTFQKMPGPWEADAQYEDTGSLLFDADNDGDLDLYVVNGGNNSQVPKTFYQDRLYVNTEKGFITTDQSLPEISISGRVVISGDYDGDGDQDLFVGGRIVPGNYPYPAQSYILRNDGGRDRTLRYTNVTEALAPELLSAGLVTSALWEDIDSDGNLDLILTGEWMPIRFFRNTGSRFEELSQDLGIAEESGWWYDLASADLDGDGDIDLIAGNLGLNYKYKASAEKPFEVYANDFDENGSNDIVLSYQKYGTKVPLRGRECSSQQVPAIKMRFETFELFADASLADIYGQQMLDNSLHYSATTFAHHWFENKGDGRFQKHVLPNQAQFSSVKAIQVFDYNQDAYPDLLLAGNHYHAEIETPRADAGVGLVLIGTEQGIFEAVPASESGLMLRGEIKDIQPIRFADGRQGYVCARNNLPVKIFVSKR